MKAILVLAAALVMMLAAQVSAQEANGLRLTATKVTLEKDKDRDAFYQWDKVEKALGLKLTARNISLKDFPAGTIEYTVLVRRWGRENETIESYTGEDKLPVLLKGKDVTLTVGKVPLGGWENSSNRKQFQDSIEGWQLIAKHDGKETVKISSGASFDKMLPKATPARK